MAVFEDLNGLNINGHAEKKKVEGKELTYLSWPWAWAEVKKRYPDAHYTIWKNADGLPYTEDPMTGYMVYTSVTIEGITHEMWLPVMNGANRAMKRVPYKYTTKYGEKSVDAATMMDINKTIMRCLVKNLAMFGLGLYIYAGEDLPEAEQEEQKQNTPVPTANVRPQSAPAAASMTTVSKAPPITPQAPATPPAAPQAAPETPGAYLQRMIKMQQQTYAAYGYNFMEARAGLIQAGLAQDVPSATMTMEQAKSLIQEIGFFYDERKRKAEEEQQKAAG